MGRMMGSVEKSVSAPQLVLPRDAVPRKGGGGGQPAGTKVVLDLVLTATTISSGLGAIYGAAFLSQQSASIAARVTVCLSVMCPLITMTQFISPVLVVVDAVQKMSAEYLPTMVFQAQATCNILGLCYGIQMHNKAILIANLFGLGCQIIFLTCTHYVQASQATRRPLRPTSPKNQECFAVPWLWYSVRLSIILNGGLYFFTFLTPLRLLGHAITLANVALFAAPLEHLGGILRTRNSSALPTTMICVSFLSNAAWSLYGLMIQDLVVVVPSMLGFMLSLFQVMVILWCRGALPFDLNFLLMPCCGEHESMNGVAKAPKSPPQDPPRPAWRSRNSNEALDEELQPVLMGMPAPPG